ncbi:efflux RND transporter periplasmic adaptor subunit [Pseudoalteromonas neustonica]|uniref:Efflux RND transporter periplasmic adaptor subunit n=1 Tax=Pseudoalteromonas neustonica TaxID=1840331 RepID=A0ABU9TX57_9GAMM
MLKMFYGIKGRWFLTLSMIMLIVLAGYFITPSSKANSEPTSSSAKPLPLISVTPITPKLMNTKLELSGVVKPIENTDIAFEVAGKVIYLHPSFIDGGIVKKGTVLIKLNPFDLTAAVTLAEAKVAKASAELEEEKAKASVAKATLLLANTPSTNPLAKREPQVKSAKALLLAAQTQLQIAQTNLARSAYRAPYDALVQNRAVGLGQVISQGQTLGRLANVAKAEVHVAIADNKLSVLPSLPINNVIINHHHVIHTGRLTRSIGTRSSSTRSAIYIVEITDPYGLLNQGKRIEFGEFVHVSVPTKHFENAAVVAQHMVTNSRIWALSANNTLQSIPVEILNMQKHNLMIQLPSDESIILVDKRPEIVRENMAVNVINSALATAPLEGNSL